MAKGCVQGMKMASISSIPKCLWPKTDRNLKIISVTYTVNATGETLVLNKYSPRKNKGFSQHIAGKVGKIKVIKIKLVKYLFGTRVSPVTFTVFGINNTKRKH